VADPSPSEVPAKTRRWNIDGTRNREYVGIGGKADRPETVWLLRLESPRVRLIPVAP
jgi:hypothetical protein